MVSRIWKGISASEACSMANDLLIARSEQLAADRGWHPPPLLRAP
jgi:hypothetical protein